MNAHTVITAAHPIRPAYTPDLFTQAQANSLRAMIVAGTGPARDLRNPATREDAARGLASMITRDPRRAAVIINDPSPSGVADLVSYTRRTR